ncbi:hypothetical protein BpHYR1_009812 [Brachionus plicatilis]|uniref:Uncharacterized protein n=1 Tax=Brachionus plicatilis TaxID=10195 RepID=A0A3M7RX96_BRAPC|nr:hypothetical protein BpHYR1_009812 [Brachionus plicatilis]
MSCYNFCIGLFPRHTCPKLVDRFEESSSTPSSVDICDTVQFQQLIQSQLQISALVSYPDGFCSITSGAIQQGVPTKFCSSKIEKQKSGLTGEYDHLHEMAIDASSRTPLLVIIFFIRNFRISNKDPPSNRRITSHSSSPTTNDCRLNICCRSSTYYFLEFVFVLAIRINKFQRARLIPQKISVNIIFSFNENYNETQEFWNIFLMRH